MRMKTRKHYSSHTNCHALLLETRRISKADIAAGCCFQLWQTKRTWGGYPALCRRWGKPWGKGALQNPWRTAGFSLPFLLCATAWAECRESQGRDGTKLSNHLRSARLDQIPHDVQSQKGVIKNRRNGKGMCLEPPQQEDLPDGYRRGTLATFSHLHSAGTIHRSWGLENIHHEKLKPSCSNKSNLGHNKSIRNIFFSCLKLIIANKTCPLADPESEDHRRQKEELAHHLLWQCKCQGGG